jgi:hypothetical protein
MSSLIDDLNLSLSAVTDGHDKQYRHRVAMRVRDSARAYINDPSRRPFGFVWLCEHLGYDPRWLGKKLLNTDTKKIRFRTVYVKGDQTCRN